MSQYIKKKNHQVSQLYLHVCVAINRQVLFEKYFPLRDVLNLLNYKLPEV